MLRISSYVLVCLSTLAIATPLTHEQMVQKGDEISGKLLQKLGGELKSQMQNSGAVNALHFCSQNALTLTEQVGKESNVTIKRITQKNRNPINRASASENALMEEIEASLKKGEKISQQKLVHSNRYYKPILINNEACLKCHGNLDPQSPLAKEIKTLYPEDKALGYQMGDLRGLIRIDF